MKAPHRLSRRLALLTSAGFTAFWVLATLAMALTLKLEQDDLLDLTLRETAELFHPILVDRYVSNRNTILPTLDPEEGDEALVYYLFSSDRRPLLSSESAVFSDLTDAPHRSGFFTTETHAFYATGTDNLGYFVVFGDPLQERWEAYKDSFIGFLVPMIVFLPLAYLLVIWIARTALRPLEDLRQNIGLRNEGRLDPITADGQPEELQAITTTLNGLMARLSTAIDGERAFATNAAHELRTPVAIALAQVQRLKSDAISDSDIDRIKRVENALRRMSRLVTRLLQMARADAGIGAAEVHQDIRALLSLILEDYRRDDALANRLNVTLPDAKVPARIDADAFAILAGNLIENAFQHAPSGTKINVDLSADGTLCVENYGVHLSPTEISQMTKRFHRQRQDGSGFGVGLHIVGTIAEQSGGELSLSSPPEGGFVATFTALR